MANIPTVAGSAQVLTRGVGGVPMARVNGSAFMAPGRAMVAAGETVSGGARFLAKTAMAIADHVERGKRAKEKVVREEVAARIDQMMIENPDPQAWPDAFEKTVSAYDKERAHRMKAEKWAPATQEDEQIEGETFKAHLRLQFKGAHTKALIQQANARLDAQAEASLRAGDHEGFRKIIQSTDRTAAQKGEALRRGLEEGLYKVANNQLDEISTLPAAQQVPAYQTYLQSLKAKTEDGKFKEYEYEDGGLSLGGRVNLESIANARIRSAQVAMNRAGRAIVARIEDGEPMEATVNAALKSGALDEETARAFLPDVMRAQAKVTAAQQRKEAAKEERAADEARRVEDEADRQVTRQSAAEMSLRARLGKDVSLRDIERAEAIGIARPKDPAGLSKEGADRLRLELAALADSERASHPAFERLSEKLNGLMGKVFLGFGDRSQLSPAKQAELLKEIAEPRIRSGDRFVNANLSKEARLHLMRQFFEVRAFDLRDGEVTEKSGDRQLSPEETSLRVQLIERFKSQAKLAPSPESLGALYFQQSAAIESWFRQNPNATPAIRAAKAQEMGETLVRQVDELVGLEALADAFRF